MSNCWLYAKLRYPGRDWLRGLEATTYTALADYILGPKVATLNLAEDDENMPPKYPPKNVVMGYEKAIRRLAYRLVREGDDEGKAYTLAKAIKKACTDPETRQFNFVVKTSSYVTTPFTDYHDSGRGRPSDRPSDRGRGGGGAAGPDEGERKSADNGKPICYPFNSEEGCSRGN